MFGASGRVGHLVTAKALERGWDVVAYVRNPARLRITNDRLRVVVGALDDLDGIARAVRGCDAVISVLGPGFTTWTLAVARGMDGVIGAMQALGVRRLVVLSTPSYHDAGDGRDPVFGLAVFAVHLLLPVAWRTIAHMGAAVAGSGLDWTLVRVPLLTNRAGTGLPVIGLVGDPGVSFSRVPRATVAEFLVKQVTDSEYVCGAPVISNGGGVPGAGRGRSA